MQNQFLVGLCFIVCMGCFVCPINGYAADDPATRMEYPSSMNPVGSGARALSLGGAFISIADDATAASWNPAGLVQLERMEMSFAFAYAHREEDNHFHDYRQYNASNTVDLSHVNYFSLAFPIRLEQDPHATKKIPNMLISLNYQHLYDFNREWDALNYKQSGDIYALGLAFASEIGKRFSVGITLNYWGDVFQENKWEQSYHQRTTRIFPPPPIPEGQTMITDNFKHDTFTIEDGWNANIGFLYDLGQLKLGGVYKLGFKADIRHQIHTHFSQEFPDEPDKNASPDPTTETYDGSLHFPASYGIGLSYIFSDQFKIAGDIYRTHWNDFEYQDENGQASSPVSGMDSSTSDIDTTTWFRFGGEYRMLDPQRPKSNFLALRAGLFYDPAPAEKSSDDFYGISAGFGYGRELNAHGLEKMIIDTACQYRWGSDVGGSMFTDYQFDQDVKEYKIYMSMIMHF
jgi:long-subunit fatty acid transport protein